MKRNLYFMLVSFFILSGCSTVQNVTSKIKPVVKKEVVTKSKFKERPGYEPFNPNDVAPQNYVRLNNTTLNAVKSGSTTTPPANFQYTVMPHFIKKVNKEISIRLSYPTDLKGNYYTMRKDKPIEYIKMIDKNDTCVIMKYTIEPKKNNRPYDITFVLDHSGSMGDERCVELQNAIIDVFKQEKIKHLARVYKFDSEVSFEGNTSNTDSIESIVKRRVGMEGFGGATSIYDALDMAISSVNSDTTSQPLIILFSDGYENSSKNNNINDIVQKAKNKKIPIFTVAFGENSDRTLLRAIADETNGIFWQTYNREEFKFLFQNELFLLNHYYELRFVPCSFDFQKLIFSGFNEFGDKVYGEKTLTGLKEVISLNINFDFDKAYIYPKYYDEIDKVASYLKKNAKLNIIIYGHTDNEGTVEYNQQLSLKRAEAVSQALVNRGIVKERIKVFGKGEAEPYVPNDSETNRYRNRRIEIQIANR